MILTGVLLLVINIPNGLEQNTTPVESTKTISESVSTDRMPITDPIIHTKLEEQFQCNIDDINFEVMLEEKANNENFLRKYAVDYQSPFELYPLLMGLQANPRVLRQVLGEPTLAKYAPRFSFGSGVLISNEKEDELFRLLENTDIETWGNALATAKIESDAIYFFRGEYVFLYQILITRILDGQLDNSILDTAIQYGITAHISDFVFAMENKVNAETIKDLLTVSHADTLKAFYYKGEYRSLTTYALFNSYYDLAITLSEMGVPSYPDVFSLGAIEILQRQKEKISEAQSESLITSLKSAISNNEHDLEVLGYSNYFDESFDKEKWELKFKPYEQMLQLAGNTSVQSAREDVNNLLFEIVSEKHLNDFECKNQIFNQLLVALNDKRRSNKPGQSLKDQFTRIDKSHALLKEAKLLFLSDEAILDYLSQDKTLYGKQAVELFREQINKELVEKLKAEAIKQEVEQPKVSADMKTLYALAKDGKWNELINLMDDIDSQEMKDAILSISLTMNAGPGVVNALIESGATVHQGLLMAATLTNNSGVIKVLVDNGLDVVQPIDKEIFPVVIAAKFGKESSLSFILGQGATPNPDILGYDALDYVLLSEEPIQRKVEMAKLLFDYGMPVGVSHKQIVNSLGYDRIDEYVILVKSFPELRPDNGESS